MENLWKKESNGKSSIYMDIFKNIETAEVSNANGLPKNDVISTHLRKKGDGKFGDNLWIDAMEYYNQSLRFAVDSENVSLAYANRAACFPHLKMIDKCLVDIEMSKRENCPKDLMEKLKKCKDDCHKVMKREQQEKTIEGKLSYDCDVNIPCLADVVKIQYNEKFGRHVVAKCDIPAGKVILAEKSFLSTTLSGPITACTSCQKTRMNFIACENCTIAMFCDEKCKKASVLHKYDCNIIYDREPHYNGPLQMMARSIYFGMEAFENMHEMIKFVEATEKIKSNYVPESVVDMQSKYRLFLTLATYSKEYKKETLILAKRLFMILIKLPTVKKAFDTMEKQRFLMHLATKHVIIKILNAINATQNQCQRVATLGLIFPLFNHACAPNLLNFSRGDQQICMTLRPVQAGQQLFVSYSTADVSTRQRQLHLLTHFGFLCACEKCDPKHTTADVTKLLSDPGYAFLQRNRKSDLLNDQNRWTMKKKCIDLLNKHGHSWYSELEFVLDMYIKCEMYEY
ncbi:histone-lysine N-methyltransferase SMYD3-like [Contarinia nasturtii]|uniref:histone-lysine N-methyltransferase SMYD3-like n=1 Tax=Contarinia nasturtii TaxID=265458 RepID=UPI0012D3A695|nr:histone-lysine N-methyltransferase SMYD3-like [Contarinia nasturtii]